MISRRLFMGAASALAATAGAAKAAVTRLPLPFINHPGLVRVADHEAVLGGKIFYKGDKGYEDYRVGSVFNLRKPNRYPAAIVMAETPDDVVAAVKLAKARGWQVGTRSGGHSWQASFMREGAMMISLANMKEMSIDADKRIATVSPSVYNTTLSKAAEPSKLFFPGAHCVAVGLGGFVMCGGHGWNSRQWGVGAANVEALDLVTADGELIHADRNTNSDYWWAARGAGPGFFGAVVRLYLNGHPTPPVQKTSVYHYAGADAEAVLTWARDMCDTFPKYLEVNLSGRYDDDGKPVIDIGGHVMADDEATADAALKLMESCPVVSKALMRKVAFADTVPYYSEGPHEVNPAGFVNSVDGAWINAPSKVLVPRILPLFQSFPTPRSSTLMMCWGKPQNFDDMCYSVQGEVYVSPSGVYTDPADAARVDEWAYGGIAKLDDLTLGGQMNDENMYARKGSKYLSAASAAKLEELRKKYDPDHRFAGFLRA